HFQALAARRAPSARPARISHSAPAANHRMDLHTGGNLMHAIKCGVAASAAIAFVIAIAPADASSARDPGVRAGASGAGSSYPGLSADEQTFFAAAQTEFTDSEGVGDGLGPRFNLDSCAGCHLQPAIGGSAPPINPQFALATAFGARN